MTQTHRERAGEHARWLHDLLRRHGWHLPPHHMRDVVDAAEQLQDEAVSVYANSVGGD